MTLIGTSPQFLKMALRSFCAALVVLMVSVQHAHGQIPLTPKYDKVIESKAYSGVKISYKAVSYSIIYPLGVDFETDNFVIRSAWNLRNYPRC